MKIGIIGFGLIGGSIAKVLKGREVVAFDKNKESLEKGVEEGIVTNYTLEINDEFQDVDMLFICTPVKYIYEYIKQASKHVKKDCIITDVGSTKDNIVTKVEEDFPDINFVGAHPMVGSEKMGYDNSRENLFENSYYLITKTKNTKEENLKKLCEIVEELKAIPIIIDTKEHDYISSVISHIPHIVASALVNLAKVSEKEDEMRKLAKGGFRDITRIASASPEIWQSICIQNKEEVLKGIQKFKKILSDFEENLISDDEEKLLEYFNTAKEYRDGMLEVKNDI